MTDRELMQQALEALMDAQLHNYALKHKETDDLITALRERLAQPQRTHWEGWEEVHPECKKQETVMAEYKFQTYAAYKTPDGEMKIGVVPEQEPVAWVTGWHDGHCVIRAANPSAILPIGIALYTTPPRREWVGLTATEVHETEGYEEDRKLYRFARAIEAKLKEKNG